MRIDTESITAKDLSWSLTPALNAAGRLGEADVAAKLLISDNAQEREQLAQQVYDFNEKRKQMVSDTYYFIHNKSEESLHENQEKLCLIIDKQINKGLTGNFAGKLMQEFGIPAIAISECEDIYVGSMRTCRGVIATDFLNQFGDFFINHGGHNFAAGFSFEKSKLEAFKQKIKEIVSKLELEEENSNISIDAEIPPQLLSPSTFRLLDIMEYDVPYTGAQLMQKLQLKSRDNFRRLYLLPALEKSLITMSVPDKPTSRNQRYIRK